MKLILKVRRLKIPEVQVWRSQSPLIFLNLIVTNKTHEAIFNQFVMTTNTQYHLTLSNVCEWKMSQVQLSLSQNVWIEDSKKPSMIWSSPTTMPFDLHNRVHARLTYWPFAYNVSEVDLKKSKQESQLAAINRKKKRSVALCNVNGDFNSHISRLTYETSHLTLKNSEIPVPTSKCCLSIW